jgi:protein-S-isoprenylcysteine O-methyltransferase Ste14
LLLLLKNILFTIIVPGSAAVYIPLLLARRYVERPSLNWSAHQILAILSLSVGAVIYLWCVWHFAVNGRGTPAPIDAPIKLVIQGLYQYVRNPMYVGVLLMIIGWSVFFQYWGLVVYGAAIALMFHLFVVLVEEPILERTFGNDYESYCASVGRWVPRVRQKRSA